MQLPPHPMFAKEDGLQYKQIHGREFEGRARFKRKCLHNKHNSYNTIRTFSPSVSQAKRSAQSSNLKSTHGCLPQLCSAFSKGVQEENRLEKPGSESLRCPGYNNKYLFYRKHDGMKNEAKKPTFSFISKFSLFYCINN